MGALIAEKLGLIAIEIPRIYQYALGLVSETVASNTSSVGNPLTIAQETLGAFINENVNNALVLTTLLIQFAERTKVVSELLNKVQAEGRDPSEAEMDALFADDDAARASLDAAIRRAR